MSASIRKFPDAETFLFSKLEFHPFYLLKPCSNDVYDFDTGADQNKKESVVNLVGR